MAIAFFIYLPIVLYKINKTLKEIKKSMESKEN